MKIISIHASECQNTKCPERNVCYLCKRDSTGGKITPSVYRSVLKELDDGTAHVHYATDTLSPNAIKLLQNGANITIPFHIYKKNKSFLTNFMERVHVSVYQLDEIFLNENDLIGVQKLYLIKDEESYLVAKDIITTGSEGVGKIHFPIDIGWAKDNLEICKNLLLSYFVRQFGNVDITIDTCATHCVANGECGYLHTYVDINYDGTYRKCPFDVDGEFINNKSIDDMIATEYEPKCLWAFVFGRKI